jgi:hypothetical protein
MVENRIKTGKYWLKSTSFLNQEILQEVYLNILNCLKLVNLQAVVSEIDGVVSFGKIKRGV